MDSIETLLSAFIVFNLAIVSFAVYLVKKWRLRQTDHATIKKKQLLEQGKIILAQENLLRAKQELLKEKEKLLEAYRKN